MLHFSGRIRLVYQNGLILSSKVDKQIGAKINDVNFVKCFHEVNNLTTFVEGQKDEFAKLKINEKLTLCFKISQIIRCHSQFLIIAQLILILQLRNTKLM